ncbi:HAD family hydrolase [Paenibacillus crassostreae]|uniref:Phosphoglycolate phosphatase n=1 Tax=Paenibacillus crassostreae TaxID=1763538 RepID=A0A167G349_9BACL|nr:HAD family hydrolase [Paenibacillus crassostreae]AOZ93808.1 phosphoglycolate phosphatase [Paenibacillus crassostreae]OAB77159.1 phosphoglycolate phosphatase [Paenibacillus crassostreae]
MIKALIFDLDGTIIDTETAWFVSFRQAYEKYGVNLTLDLYSQCIGTNLNNFDPYEYLITEMKLPIDRKQFRQSIKLRYSQLMEKEKVRLGILEYLEAARTSGIKIGLASSSSREWVDKYLDQLGIRHYFECIRTSDDVENVKPDPELYLQTLECLGVKAEEAIAIEDSPNGSLAAAAAGMHCIVTPNEITKSLEFDPAFYRVDNLIDIDFGILISELFTKKTDLKA